ncbi:MAG: ABC transporter permease [Verrucomicrobiales bacterium]|nr:ABC transporter permease [Verrucomicrobiales bacterium]
MNDLKFAARQLLKHPGFTAIASLTLALGIGVNTSMYSAFRELLARPLPFPDPDALVQVFQSSAHSRLAPHHSAPNFLDYQQAGVFESLAAYHDKSFNLAETGLPAERVPGLQVSASYFSVLGIQPELGRLFTPEEDQPGRNEVVILDHGFWQRRFAGDPTILGRVLRLDGESVTVVGVMPARFHDFMLMGAACLWRPIALSEEQRTQRGHHYLKTIARLPPGTTLPQAQAATDLLAQRQLQSQPENAAEGLRILPLSSSSLPPQARTILWSIMALAGLVLLIACANLANLQLARTIPRGRDFAIRAALGAARGRLLYQSLLESLWLAVLGGLLGLILAQWGNALLRREFVSDGQSVLSLRPNLGVLVFALAASTLSGLVFGFLPAWMGSRVNPNDALKQGARGSPGGGRSQSRLQHALIVAQVALALILLASAALVVNGLRGHASLNPGWRYDHLTSGYLTLPDRTYGTGDSLRGFERRLIENLRAVPGVEDAAVCWNLPVRQFNTSSTFQIEGRPTPPNTQVPRCSVNGISPRYFTTLGMSLLAGRAFTEADTAEKPPVVIIDDVMAKAFWPGESALGQRVNGAEIVGVVNHVFFPGSPAEVRTPYQTYRPFAQEPHGTLSVVARGALSGETLRRVVAQLDPDQPVGSPGPTRAEVAQSFGRWEVGGRLLGAFALLGLSLAALGLYGVISGFVLRRTHEIGLRMALGAQRREVLALVIGKGFRLSVLGTALGLIGAAGMSRLLASVMPAMPVQSGPILLLVAAVLIGVSVLACWIPARRATRVDPMVALRTE